MVNETQQYVDKRTDAEYLRQKNSILFPILIFLLGPPIGELILIIITLLPINLSNISFNQNLNFGFMFIFIIFSYILGAAPALIAAPTLLLIARRVPASPHLIAWSLPVGFLATLLSLVLQLNSSQTPRLSDIGAMGALGAVAALGSVLVALACRCVPSPIDSRSGQ
jgi:hypothetical protein